MNLKQRRAYNKGIERRRLKKDASCRRAARKGHTIRRDDRAAEDDPIYQQMLRERDDR